MDNKDVNFSSKNIKRRAELITRVKKKVSIKDTLKTFFKKYKTLIIITLSAIAAIVILIVAIIIIIELTRPVPPPPTTDEEVLELVDQINSLNPDLSDPDIANEEKDLMVSDIDEKAKNTDDAFNKAVLDYTKSTTLYKYGDYNGAIENHRQILATLEADNNYEKIIEVYEFIAECYVMLGDKPDAIKSYESALSYFDIAIAAKLPVTILDKGYYEAKLAALKNS
jgi:tetratricopeptide (TPR) repeat protein